MSNEDFGSTLNREQDVLPGQRAKPREAIGNRRRFSGVQTSRTPEYLVIGHICADLQPDGKAILGGTALFSALTAARLGWRTAVLTRGIYGQKVDGVQIPSIEPFASEMDIIVQDADTTTLFENSYRGGMRTQRLLKWAGPIDLRGLPPHWRNARVLHLGPIAQEIEPRQTGLLAPGFLGVTPQGWLRQWSKETNYRVTHQHLRLPADLVGRMDSIVVSDEEIANCRDTVEAVAERRVGVITLGGGGCRALYSGHRATIGAYPVQVVDYTGAGDVFAAAFFTKLSDRSVSVISAARYANAAAALSLREAGVAGAPYKQEVDSYIAETDPPKVRY